MISPKVPCYYAIHSKDEAAELIAAMFSPAVMVDIADVVVVSKLFDNDIEPIHEMDAAIEIITSAVAGEISAEEQFNPLYLPNSSSELHDMFDTIDGRNDALAFVGMNANLFVVKLTQVNSALTDDSLISAVARYQQFELPSYSEIFDEPERVLN